MVCLVAHLDGLFLIVHEDFTCAGHAAFTHATGHYSGVRSHAAAHSEDTLCHSHSAEVFGRSLDTHEYHFLFLFGPFFSLIGREYNLTGGCARGCGKTFCHYFCPFESVLVEYGVQEFIELLRLHSEQGSLLIDHAVAEEVHGDVYHGFAGAFAVTSLEHP